MIYFSDFGGMSGVDVASLNFKTGSYTLAGATTSTLSSVSGYVFNRGTTRIEAQPGTALLSFATDIPAVVPGVGLWSRYSQSNFVPNSLTIGGTGWSATSMTVTTGQSDPTGGTSAVKLTTTAAGNPASYVSLSSSLNISGNPACYAVIAKADTSNFLWMQINSGTDSAGVTFDLSSGSAGTPFLLGGSLANLGNPTAHIISLGSGWYLCGIWADVSTTVNLFMGAADAAGSRNHSSSKAVIVYNAQIIAGLNIDSYSQPQIITTSGSTVTTADDNLYFVATPVGDEDFFFYAVVNMDALISRDRVVARLSDGTVSTNRIQLQLSPLHKPVVQISNGGVNTSLTNAAAATGVGTVAIGVRRKSGKYTSIFKSAAGTITIGTESGTVAMPTYDRFEVGGTAGSNNLLAVVEKVIVRTGTFTDADLTTIFSAL